MKNAKFKRKEKGRIKREDFIMSRMIRTYHSVIKHEQVSIRYIIRKLVR